MAQSYKVFIGESVLIISDMPLDRDDFDIRITDPEIEDWTGIILFTEMNASNYLVQGDTELNWKNFKANYQVIEAAGGLVQNQSGDWLFIHRNRMWDLPKGKLEIGESIEECAVREVAEECGIQEPTILKPLAPTYHTYELKGQRILKKTHWYLMKSSDTSELIPQTEEGITNVEWVSTEKAVQLAEDSFGSIREVVKEGM